ncbi:MAG: Gfo/Idh/MocA family oxidoreductase [Armatimonadota bacterium]
MRVALIGTSGIAGAHIKGWTALGDAVEMAYLVDVDREAAEEAKAEHFPGAEIIADWRDLLERDDFDAADICTPTRFHAEMSIELHQAGKCVMTEKPLCETMDEADQMRATIDPDGPAFMVEHRWLFEAPFMSLLEHIPALGDLHWMRMRLGHALDISPGIKASGALLDMGYHHVYTALHLMGPAEGVYARAGTYVQEGAKNDSSLIALTHVRGQSVLEPNFSSVGPVGLYRGIEVYGSEGAAIVTVAPERKLFVSPDRNTTEEHEWTVTSPWAVNVVERFNQVCLGEAENPCGIEEGYAAMQVIDRAQKSLEDGCTH